MKKAALALLCMLASAAAASAQSAPFTDSWAADYRYNDARWNASWVTSPDATDTYDVLMFRRTVTIPAAPKKYVVHVSADNRYKLYVNGTYVCNGPCKGDPLNWCYETVDLAPYLKPGKNVVSAVVWNFGEERPVAVMSLGNTAFLMQGDTDAQNAVNTGKDWKVLRCTAYSPVHPKVRGYYAAGCTDRVDCAQYPWGWQDAGFDDSSWSEARSIREARAKGAGDYPKWQLVPRPLPAMERKTIKFSRGVENIKVPPGPMVEFLIDGSVLTTGYPTITFSGGKGAQISISYAESLYEKDGTYSKGDRRKTMGKQWVGYSDEIIADGGQNRSFEPLWWRTWRYIRIKVKNGSEPLVLNSIAVVSDMYPFELASTFASPGNDELPQMLEIGWRTARLCSHETYMDCPYYEQLQYFGDSRIQALVTMFNTRDYALPRRLMEMGKMSMSSDGLTQSRYPSHLYQFISPYSLTWIMTCHDWWMYRGDEAFLSTLLPAMRMVLGTFKSHVGADGSLHRMPFWNFADWADLHSGTFPADKDGRIAYLDLMYLIALQHASQMEDAFGDKMLADGYRATAAALESAIKKNYWSEARAYFADNGELAEFSQHANVLAIIAGIVKGDDASQLFRRLIADSSLRPCTIYFRYYLQEAMALSGNGDMLLGSLDVLREQMALGLTTWAEMPEPSRSDCHAWGASPNIEFYRMLLGIDSAAPGFAKVRVAPCLCGLKEVSGSIPHPRGDVKASYVMDGDKLKGEVVLPAGVSGEFVWQGAVKPLHPGKNRL